MSLPGDEGEVGVEGESEGKDKDEAEGQGDYECECDERPEFQCGGLGAG